MTTAFWSIVAERAIKTVAQTGLAAITASGVLNAMEIDWVAVGGVSLLAGILSVLTSVAIPSQELKNAKDAHSE
jgi:Kef-type K+ transport system membrane component KefB